MHSVVCSRSAVGATELPKHSECGVVEKCAVACDGEVTGESITVYRETSEIIRIEAHASLDETLLRPESRRCVTKTTLRFRIHLYAPRMKGCSEMCGPAAITTQGTDESCSGFSILVMAWFLTRCSQMYLSGALGFCK